MREGEEVYRFEIVCDSGTTVIVEAKNRSEAIEIYCREKGCSKDYVKAHSVVRKTVKGGHENVDLQ